MVKNKGLADRIYYYLYKLGVIKKFNKTNETLKSLELIFNITNFNYIFKLSILKIKKLFFYQTKIDYPSKFRISQTSWLFYYSTLTNKGYSTSLYSGLRFFWIGFRFWIVGILLFLVAFYYFSYIRLLPFNKVLMEWLLIVMFLYWVLSGFVFFIKKYQYSKFTSVIQRFWKRTFILFWLIEGGIFLCFFYLTMNASEEPVYMYDQMKIYKHHLFSWRWFLLKLIPSILVILLTYYLQLMLKWNIFFKQSVIILAITIILLYIVWLEFYQFFHIINFYGNLNWVYDSEEFLWNLEIEAMRTRLFNNYIAICLLAKFWHLVFIFVFWVFFVLRINEIKRVRYPLLAANYQNFIFLYIMTWLYMSPWLKFIFRKELDITYYWFFSNIRINGFKCFLIDVKLFFMGFYYCVTNFFNINYNFNFDYNFFYWIESSSLVDFDQYRKHIIRNLIIQKLNA